MGYPYLLIQLGYSGVGVLSYMPALVRIQFQVPARTERGGVLKRNVKVAVGPGKTSCRWSRKRRAIPTSGEPYPRETKSRHAVERDG